MKNLLRIATRNSKLALWQANHVAQQWQQHFPETQIELVPLTTQGDKITGSLAKFGGKGLFVKELETALLHDQADIAVHSMKDVPPVLTTEFAIPAMLSRDNPRDVLVSEKYQNFAELPSHARVGTCSVRRQAQLLAKRSDLTMLALRGNVETRLAKLAANDYDAIILAAAGLQRLNLTAKIREYFAVDFLVPAVGQGAIGIECLADNTELVTALQKLNHSPTQLCVELERDLVRALNGNCDSPIGSYATIQANQVTLHGLVAKTDGSAVLQFAATKHINQCQDLGTIVAAELLRLGAADLL